MARRPPGPMWEAPIATWPMRPLRPEPPLRPGPGAATPVAQAAHSADLTIAASRPLGKAHGLLRRLEQSAGFIVALLLFRRGIAVGDNSGARLHVDRAILDERRAQDDAAVHLAIGRKVTHTASIGSALLLL